MNFLTILAPLLGKFLERIIPDPEKRAEAELEMQKVLNEAQIEMYKAQQIENEAKRDVITTEMKAGWAGNWRAYLMIACGAMIVNNWIFAPLLNAFLAPLGLPIAILPIPGEAWALMSIGLGGYIGRESLKTYTEAKVEKARIENPPNDKAFYDVLRAKVFNQGMTQEQVNALEEALRARGN